MSTRKQHLNVQRNQCTEGAYRHAWFALVSTPVDGVEFCLTIPVEDKTSLERRDDRGTSTDPAAPSRNATSMARLRAAFKDKVGDSSDTVEERFRRGKLDIWEVTCGLPDPLIIPVVVPGFRARILIEERIERTSLKGVLGVGGV